MFHVERLINISSKLILVIIFLFMSCITPRHTVEIDDYILLNNGKEIIGKEEGLTAFMFENDPKKIPFHQFIGDRQQIGNYNDISYWVTIDGDRYKVFVYENDEIEKYFDTSQFMVTKAETEINVVGSKAKFIALSMITARNEDCLASDSLFRNIALTYLKQIKDEYLNS